MARVGSTKPLDQMARAVTNGSAPRRPQGVVAENFELVGHTDLGATDINAAGPRRLRVDPHLGRPV